MSVHLPLLLIAALLAVAMGPAPQPPRPAGGEIRNAASLGEVLAILEGDQGEPREARVDEPTAPPPFAFLASARRPRVTLSAAARIAPLAEETAPPERRRDQRRTIRRIRSGAHVPRMDDDHPARA